MPVVLILQPKLSFTNYKGKVQIDCPNDCQQTTSFVSFYYYKSDMQNDAIKF